MVICKAHGLRPVGFCICGAYTHSMDKDQVAAILEMCGTLLELQGENPFRCRAYYAGARALSQLEADLAELIATNKLREIPGLGETLCEKIVTLVSTGTLPFYEDLKAKTPPGLLDMLRIPGMGPKKVKALYDNLAIDSIEKLKAACDGGQVAELKGFGAKTQQKILDGLTYLGQMSERVRLDQAMLLAMTLLEGLKKAPGIKRLEVCGSLRRCKETVRDLDFLVSSDRPGPIIEAFAKLPAVVQVIGQGDTKCSVTVDMHAGSGRRTLMNADLRVVSDAQFAFALNYFTGSKEHNVAMRQRAIKLGLKLNEYELAGPKKSIPCTQESDLYEALGLAYVPPELRENTGEIEAAESRALPHLIDLKDLTGTFHCHTTWSDGTASLEQMALAAKDLGYKYLGIADHSQSLVVGNGLKPERVKEQHAEIDKLNKKLKGIHLFKGTECDILADGRLDYPDDVLASFDYVVASVHTLFNQSQEDMTKRIVRAVSHPRVTMLGHATGRLLLRRDGYKVDLEAVMQAAAKHGTMIEINSNPYRLDLDWIHCKRAKALGVQLVINPDAHATGEIPFTEFGVAVARRGWLEKGNVFNTQSLPQITKELERRRK